MCEKGEEKPRHYLDVGLVGFTTDHNAYPVVRSGFRGGLAGRKFASVVEIYDNPVDIDVRHKDDGAGGVLEIKYPVWYRAPSPGHGGGTPLSAALRYCIPLVSDWCAAHSKSYPPLVFLFTDGESSDGNPEEIAERLKWVGTENGNVLLYTCHVRTSSATPVLLPSSEDQLPVAYGRSLFRMTSELPYLTRCWFHYTQHQGQPGSRGMLFNADPTGFESAVLKLFWFPEIASELNYKYTVEYYQNSNYKK